MPESRKPRLVVRQLVPDDWAPRKPKRKALIMTLGVTSMCLLALGVWLGHFLWPVLPQSLSPVEAARILHSEKGFAGYSLISSDGNPDGSLRHDIFCPSCGNPIADVQVTFLAPRPPQPGSRLAIMTQLAKDATAAPAPKKRAPSPPQPIQVVASK